MGKSNFTNKIIVNINLLSTVAAGLIRRMNDDFFHKSMEKFWKQLVGAIPNFV